MKFITTLALSTAIAWTSAFAPTVLNSQTLVARRMTATTDDSSYAIDAERRLLLNLLVLGLGGITHLGIGVPYLAFFVPPGAGGPDVGGPALDVRGNVIVASDYLDSKPAGDRSLVQGLKGDATYLLVKDDHTAIESFALNAICTHLGCVVPWSPNDRKFICPCHGSQYDSHGSVVRGPAPLPLALAHVATTTDGTVLLTPWLEDDFRTGQRAWWN